MNSQVVEGVTEDGVWVPRTPVFIRKGTCQVTCGVDHSGQWLALTAAGEAPELIRLPRWKGGVGGMELVVSTDERFIALFMYSGQSSQGYEIFSTQPALKHVGGLPEARGHGTPPVFSPSGRWLVSLIDSDRLVRGTQEHFETVQDDASTDLVIVDWARLHVHALDTLALSTVAVGTELPRSTNEAEVLEWQVYDAVRFENDENVLLRMPWAQEVAVQLPPRAAVTVSLAQNSPQK